MTSPPPHADSSLIPTWQIDQRGMRRGIGHAMETRMTQCASLADPIWQETARLANLQPIVSSAADAVCQQIQDIVTDFRAVADQLVVIGTGGASLGAQALCAFAPYPGRVLFLENCDPHSMADIFSARKLHATAWVIISKSGATVETLSASLALIAQYSTADLSLAGRVLVITSEGERPLRALATHQGFPVLAHPAGLGGRFSVFSCVGLLPAAFAGLDIANLSTLAQDAWNTALSEHDPDLFDAASWFAASMKEKPLHCVMAYSDRLRPYTKWYKQLWAESLGKNGLGPTPITAIGTVDQHSQLQLYLDGPRDKLFTLILPDGAAGKMPLAHVAIDGLDYLGGHDMQAVLQASAEATAATIANKNIPLRILRAHLTAESLCTLMVRTMLETLLVAAMIGVDPYSQPAVEEGKHLTRKKLQPRDA